VERRRIRLTATRRRSIRRSGFSPGRRFAFTAAFALCLLGHLGAVAAADDTTPLVTATIEGPSGTPSTESISAADLKADPGHCPLYTGPPPTQNTPQSSSPGYIDPNNTWALATIFPCMSPPISLASIQSVTVLHQNGASEADPDSQLSSSDLAPGGNWLHPDEQPVVVYAVSGGDEYFRPARSASDVNVGDQVYDTPISVEVFEGKPLAVAIETPAQTITTGASLSFGANVTGVQGTPSYHWDFDGGATNSTAEAPNVTFSRAGTFNVALQVTDSNGDTGVAQLVTITVNSPSGSPHQQTGTTTQPGNGNDTGSTSPTGHKGGKPVPPGSGGTKPSGNDSGGGKHGKSGQGNQSNHNHRHQAKRSKSRTDSGGTGTSTGTSSGGTGTGTASAGTSAGSGGTQTSSIPSTPLPASPTPATAHHTSPRQGNSSGLKAQTPSVLPEGARIVTGDLISHVVTLPLGSSPLVHPESGGTGREPVVRQGVTASPVPALVGGLIIVLLLGLGAGRELRGRRAWRTMTLGA
jgi:PKD repeat protein